VNRRGVVAAVAASVLAARPLVAQPPALRIAVVPFLSPTVMLAAFRPLREHLERELGRSVELYTARNFAALLTQIQHAPDDLTLVAAHIARLAQLDWGFTPLAATLERTTAQLLVRADNAWPDAQALRGGTLGVLDRRALPAIVTMNWLQARGLAADRDYRVAAQPSADSALHALARGAIDALALAASQLQVVPPSTPRGDRVLADTGPMPGPVYIARPRLGADDIARLRRALLRFEPDPAQPETAINTRLRSPAPAELAALDGFLPKLRREMARARA
jgi:phosphonate transport system substrate-binding protein